MTFGVLAGVKSRLPGSTRLGEWARWKSRPARSPDPCSRRGSRKPSVVPGTTGDSTITVVCGRDRKSTRLNSSHVKISYAVFCLKKKKTTHSHNDVRDVA